MIKKGSVVHLGKVTLTQDYDYRHFSYAVLAVTATVIFLGYLWFTNIIQGYIIDAVKIHYTVAFGILLLVACLTFLGISFSISRAHNAVKRPGGMKSEVIVGLFGIELADDDPEYLKEIVRDKLNKLIDVLQYIANLAVILGIIGTVDGLAHSFAVLKHAEVGHVMDKLPEMAGSLSQFGTTALGIVVYVIVRQMYRLARSGALDLKHRIFRILHHKGSTA